MNGTTQKSKDAPYSRSGSNFNWGLHPHAEKFLKREVQKFLRRNSLAEKLAEEIEENTSTHFFDWIDHMVIPGKKTDANKLKHAGFEKADTSIPNDAEVYQLGKSTFPPILICESKVHELALKPEYIDNFLKRQKIKTSVEGARYSPYRRAVIHEEQGHMLTAVERRGTCKFIFENDKRERETYRNALKLLSKRERVFDNERRGILEVEKLIKNIIQTLSPARTADAFFRAERMYWERKNSVAEYQRKRQDLHGLGWGNHDHHTFRSSRENFIYLIRIFERLGFMCRERFFAGEEAGWGAQLLEHPDCNIVVFADVDITEEEKDFDFAHKGLKRTKKLGTIGMWISLHGESILQSGMHHMAARFHFTKLRSELKKAEISMMKPFSNFTFLKQAFTEGEYWKIERKHLDALRKRGIITSEQYKRFLQNGAIGSHLENIQRRQGFKGFNQDSVTAIIQATDPRKQKGVN
ncbi:MAG: hypothetical protein MRK02_08140 [Candidatus Scalindua sp.]|nr:hypothetical protein [Candidatus Scalindua sp.]